MNIKVLISILLLITYSLGFAHNLIPHSHNIESEEYVEVLQKIGHSHNYSNTKEYLHTDHEHITHGNHYDEGVYDLLVCFLHKTERQQNNCNVHHYLPTQSNRDLSNSIQKVKLVATLTDLFNEIEQVVLIIYSSTNSERTHTVTLKENSPLRGPPLLS